MALEILEQDSEGRFTKQNISDVLNYSKSDADLAAELQLSEGTIKSYRSTWKYKFPQLIIPPKNALLEGEKKINYRDSLQRLDIDRLRYAMIESARQYSDFKAILKKIKASKEELSLSKIRELARTEDILSVAEYNKFLELNGIQ